MTFMMQPPYIEPVDYDFPTMFDADLHSYSQSLETLLNDASQTAMQQQQDEHFAYHSVHMGFEQQQWASPSFALPTVPHPSTMAPMPFMPANNKRSRPIHWDDWNYTNPNNPNINTSNSVNTNPNSHPNPNNDNVTSCSVNNKRRKSTKSKSKESDKKKKTSRKHAKQQIRIKQGESESMRSISPSGQFDSFLSSHEPQTPGTTPRPRSISAACKKTTSSAFFTETKQVMARSTHSTQRRVRQMWSEQEDKQLLAALKIHGESFSKVQTMVNGRDAVQCRTRWHYALKPGLRKGAWSKVEDERLRLSVHEQMSAKNSEDISVVDWPLVAETIVGRNAKKCRERWLRNLEPSLKKGNWEPWEDEYVLSQQREFGNKWAKISRGLPSRTEHTVKTRWHSLMRVRNRRCWTGEEDALLLLYREKSLTTNQTWEDIAAYFPNRTKYSLVTRYKVLRKRGRVADDA
jgi:hypothetical protein